MKKVQHNLKIAKSVAKRVEDLKQQVQSDTNQLQKITNVAELDQNLPFKKSEKQQSHQNVGRIPSVKDSGTGVRHGLNVQGTLLGTASENMNVRQKQKKHSNGKQQKYSSKYYEDIDKARKQIL